MLSHELQRLASKMCNLYNVTTNQQAIRDFARITQDTLGNLPPSLDAYPDRPAPVVRNVSGGRDLAMLTWGMPTPPQFLKFRDAPDSGVTNIRNTNSLHWRRWLGTESRCLIPATAFTEYGQKPDPTTKRKPLHWFALDETQPLFFFAGIWTTWRGTRGSGRTPRPGEHQLFAFLTTEPNAVVSAGASQGHAGDPDDAGGGRDVAQRRLGDSEGSAAAAYRRTSG